MTSWKAFLKEVEKESTPKALNSLKKYFRKERKRIQATKTKGA